VHTSLTLVLYGGEWSATRCCHFIPKERVFGNHWLGRLVGHRAGLDVMVKKKISSPYRESNPGHPSCSLVTTLIELSQLPSCYSLHQNIK